MSTASSLLVITIKIWMAGLSKNYTIPLSLRRKRLTLSMIKLSSRMHKGKFTRLCYLMFNKLNKNLYYIEIGSDEMALAKKSN